LLTAIFCDLGFSLPYSKELRNLFMKKLTCDRVVPIIPANVKPEFTAPQQQRPLHLNQRTCRGKL
jgi:hypothetical protein